MDNRFYFGFNTSEERKKRRKAELYSMSEQVSTFFWDEAPQHGLEMREGQQDMSFEIVDALINDQHFAIEAGVGIGKSFGYLVPVLLYSKRMNKPVIIATSTIALQEQLWRDVHTVMPLLGLNRDVILAKGQTHYLCNKRADEYMCDPKADPPDALKEGIQQGYEERKDFPEVLPQGVWDKVNVQRFSMKNCGSCEKKCKYYKVRAALKLTDGVVLCNQDFLTQHVMKLRRGQDGLINAAADLLVVDEAHNLDDKVRSATTERFGQGMLFGMIKSAFYELRSFDQSSVSGEKRDALKEGIKQGYEERKDFPEVLPQGVWDKVNVQRFSMKNCGSCEKKCKYYKVRAALKFTDGVVLCNQDFLTQHLMKLRRGQEGLINAAADLLVVDEAHNLDDKVRSATTERFGQGMLFGMIKSAFYELRSSDQSSVSKEKREAESAIIAFYNCLKAQVQKQINEAEQDMRYADRFFFDNNGSAIELLTEMNAAIHNLSSSIQIYSSMDFRNNRSFAASDDLDAVSESLSELLDQIDDMLIWIEQHGSNTELVYCPKNTKEIVSRLYFNGDERTILTSATLTNATSGSLEEQYSYFISNTGFPAGDRGCLSEPKPSPYPYDEHAMIYYCDDLPHPTREHEAFIEKGVERLLEILSISNGKALVLFTAKTDMEEVYSILSEKNLPYKILMQQPGSSQDKVLNEFKEDTNSVLLGTGAYWEGISIEGKSLSNVIIFRLPFPVPDPIIEYKCSVAKDALMDVRVPEMIIKLKQGIGRLIRNFTDTGIVCIIDRRLRDEPPERYHDITWDSLPIKNRTSSLDELRKFYEGLPSPRNDDTNGSLFGNIEQPPKKRQSENGGVSCCTMKICTKKNNI